MKYLILNTNFKFTKQYFHISNIPAYCFEVIIFFLTSLLIDNHIQNVRYEHFLHDIIINITGTYINI